MCKIWDVYYDEFINYELENKINELKKLGKEIENTVKKADKIRLFSFEYRNMIIKLKKRINHEMFNREEGRPLTPNFDKIEKDDIMKLKSTIIVYEIISKHLKILEELTIPRYNEEKIKHFKCYKNCYE